MDSHNQQQPASPAPAPQDPAAVQDLWDRRYAERDTLWSGEPNSALITEAGDLVPGRALDVGCGEGADALWLAGRGWDVTALDVSRVALDRAVQHAARQSAQVTWLHTGLVDADLPEASFDLVSAQYPALLRTDSHVAEEALFRAVAPGGILLVVHHAMALASHGHGGEEYVLPEDIAGRLAVSAGDSWQIELFETRPRNVASGAGAHHKEDVVLRARRLP